MNLDQFVQMRIRQAENLKVGRVPRMELFGEDVPEFEEDVGALRLSLFQAALKERRILESKG